MVGSRIPTLIFAVILYLPLDTANEDQIRTLKAPGQVTKEGYVLVCGQLNGAVGHTGEPILASDCTYNFAGARNLLSYP